MENDHDNKTIALLDEINRKYRQIPLPKYLNIELKDCEALYFQLTALKPDASGIKLYQGLLAALSQILAKLRSLSVPTSEAGRWINASERGISKAIGPLVRKPGRQLEYPFEKKDPVTGRSCSISNGHWEARNYMVMDVLAYIYLLKEGGDRVPEEPAEIFSDIESIRRRELEHGGVPQTGSGPSSLREPDVHDIESIKGSGNWVGFTDSKFREFTGLHLSSSEILALLQQTSRVEFKLVYPVRLRDEHNIHREKPYSMNLFSRPYELGYIDEAFRNGPGSVYRRRYYVAFNTILGELFIHNLKAQNYDWVRRELYVLPPSAQLFFRRCLVHNNCRVLEFNVETISERLDLTDLHRANRIRSIALNALEPLKTAGMIKSYKLCHGLSGPKFVVTRDIPTSK